MGQILFDVDHTGKADANRRSISDYLTRESLMKGISTIGLLLLN